MRSLVSSLTARSRRGICATPQASKVSAILRTKSVRFARCLDTSKGPAGGSTAFIGDHVASATRTCYVAYATYNEEERSMLNRFQILSLIILSLLFWLAAALYVRLAPGALTDPTRCAIAFATTMPVRWLSVVL